MNRWPLAFIAYAKARWGGMWKWGEVAPEVVRDAKRAFRAGFAAGLKAGRED